MDKPGPAAPQEAYAWTPPPPDCPLTGWPQIDNPDFGMCACGHRHITITVWGGGGSGR
jgi:hypothetical protein